MTVPWTPAEKSLLASRYPLEGSLALARDLHRSPDSITSQARRYGYRSLLARSRQAATRASRSCTVDMGFFGRMNPDVAWVLGVIWACGAVKEKHRLALRMSMRRDRREVLLRVQKLMASRHSLQTYATTHVLEIPNSRLIQSLIGTHGLPPRSAKIRKPPSIDDAMVAPFAAGHLAATSHQCAEHVHWTGHGSVMVWLSKAIQAQTGVPEPNVFFCNHRDRVIRWRDEADVRAIRGWLGVSD